MKTTKESGSGPKTKMRRKSVAGKKSRMTQAERTALSDSRMLDAAIRLVDERGTHDTTLKDVGERAGYSRGLASSRFGSKEAMFFELVNRFNQRWKEAGKVAVGDHTGLEALRRANQGLIDFFHSEATFIRAMYIIWYEMVGYSDPMRMRLAQQHAAYRHGVAKWMREAKSKGEARQDISAEQVAVHYCSGVFGLIYQWLVSPSAIDIESGLADLRDITLELVKVPEGEERRGAARTLLAESNS